MEGDQRPRFALWKIGLIQAIVFGSGWGAMMYHLSWKDKGMSLALGVGLSVLAGALFGGTMSWFEARRRRNEDALANRDPK